MDNVSGTPSDCYYCHSQSAGHIPTDNTNDPFRLGYGSDTTGQKGSAALKGAYADAINTLCLKCHGSATDRSGVAEAATIAVNMQTHANGITGTKYATWPVTTWKCVDCHDPHGDGTDASNRIQMIRIAINQPTGAGNANVGSNSKGTPLRNPGWTGITFTGTTGFGAGSYAISGTTTWGICEGCHRQTYTYNQSTDNVNHATSRCTDCHSHTGGFKASCDTCHGDIAGGIRGDGSSFPPEGPTAGSRPNRSERRVHGPACFRPAKRRLLHRFRRTWILAGLFGHR